MKKTFLTTALLFCCFLAAFAAIADFSGIWTGTLTTNNGDLYPLQYTFKIDGDKLNGSALSPKGELPIENGKITGSDFKFTVTLGEMDIEHTGKFYADSVSMDLTANGSKTHTVLVRKK